MEQESPVTSTDNICTIGARYRKRPEPSVEQLAAREMVTQATHHRQAVAPGDATGVPGQASGGRARPSRTRASPVWKAAPASRSGALTNISIVGSRPVANCRLR